MPAEGLAALPAALGLLAHLAVSARPSWRSWRPSPFSGLLWEAASWVAGRSVSGGADSGCASSTGQGCTSSLAGPEFWPLAARCHAGASPWALPLWERLFEGLCIAKGSQGCSQLLLVCLYHSWINRVSSKREAFMGAPRGVLEMEMRATTCGAPWKQEPPPHRREVGGPSQEGLCVCTPGNSPTDLGISGIQPDHPSPVTSARSIFSMSPKDSF